MERKRISVRATKLLSCTGKKIVRYCMMMATVLAIYSCTVSTHQVVKDFEGVRIHTQNVGSMFILGHTAHYIVYDDIDSGYDYEIIRLTPKAYRTIEEALKNHRSMQGYLKPVRPYESVEYEFKIEKMIAIEHTPIQINK